MLPISSRLKVMANYIPEGEILVDIGTDHAYLPIYATIEKNLKKAIAGEYNKGPYIRAVSHVEQKQLEDKISVRLGNGLDVLHEDEATVLTIAGMGGNLIVEILENGLSKLSSMKRLILQPMNGERNLRKWLCEHSYSIIAEQILKEQGIIYEIIVAEPAVDKLPLTSNQLKFGPCLLIEKAESFIEKWEKAIEKQEKIMKAILDKGSIQSIDTKRDKMQNEIQTIRDVLSNDERNF